MRSIFEELVGSSPDVVRAVMCEQAEWDARLRGPNQTYFPVAAAEAHPGLFWKTAFGPAYLRTIGLDRFDALPSGVVETLGDCRVVTVYSSPASWSTESGQRSLREAVLDTLGREFFYDVKDPNRPTLAPDFLR